MGNGITKGIYELLHKNRKSFILAFVAGLLAHLVKFTNYYPAWDR